MNSNTSNSKKTFLITAILFNLLITILIIREIIYLAKIQGYENEVSNLQNKLPSLNINNINYLNERFKRIETRYSSENSLVELINFIESNISDLNLKVLNNKALEVTDKYISYQIELSGNIDDIYQFISRIESDKTLKEITSSEIKFKSGFPVIKIVLRSYKL